MNGIRVLETFTQPDKSLYSELVSLGASPVAEIQDGAQIAAQWLVMRRPTPFLLKLYGVGESIGEAIGRIAAAKHASDLYHEDPPQGLMFVLSVRLNGRLPGTVISLAISPVSKIDLDTMRLAWLKWDWFDGVEHSRALKKYMDPQNEPTTPIKTRTHLG